MKKTVAAMICVLLLAGLCACNNEQKDEGAEVTTQSQETVVAEDTTDTQSEPAKAEIRALILWL